MKKLTGIFLALCMMLCLLSIQAFADEIPTVSLDVGMENTENEDYKVKDDAINLSKEGQVYELTGTTDKKIQIWGSNSPDPVKTFYLRLNNATIGGGITIWNTNGAKLVIEVPSGTTNTISRVYSVDLTIRGAGTLNATDLGSTQAASSALHITDTTIRVSQSSSAGDSSQWNGTCVLDGAANVTYISNTDYAPLKVGVGGSSAHSLTLKDNAKLYCLQANAADPSPYSVDGLSIFSSAPLKLQDNAYLEAQGRATSGEYAGYGIVSYGNVSIEGNATINATAYDAALCTSGSLSVSGGSITAKSESASGIYASSSASISNATIVTSGASNGIFSDGSVTIENSTVKASSSADTAIFSRDTVTLTNSVVAASGAKDCSGIGATNGVTASGCWIETSGTETLDSAPDSISNSVLFNGSTGKVIGSAAIPNDVSVDNGMTLDIPEGTTLTIPEGKTLTNNGTINRAGSIERLGTLICNSHIGGKATCTAQAVCDICGTAYGDLDPSNHSGEAVWSTTEKTHTQTWNCCSAVAVAEEAHEWENSVCKKCAYVCQHAGGKATCKDKAVCEICGEAYGALDPAVHTGEKLWSMTEKTHAQTWSCCGAAAVAEQAHNWENGTCKDCGYVCKHTGGTATCKEKAACTLCGASYGELDPKNHANLKHVSAKSATQSTDGNKEYWYCSDCGKYFADKNAAKEITKADTVVAKGTSGTPSTGDGSMFMLWAALLLVSGGALLFAAGTNRKRNFEK